MFEGCRKSKHFNVSSGPKVLPSCLVSGCNVGRPCVACHGLTATTLLLLLLHQFLFNLARRAVRLRVTAHEQSERHQRSLNCKSLIPPAGTARPHSRAASQALAAGGRCRNYEHYSPLSLLCALFCTDSECCLVPFLRLVRHLPVLNYYEREHGLLSIHRLNISSTDKS